jgi:hypothetical protein
MPLRSTFLGVVALLAGGVDSSAQQDPQPSYGRDVRPILADRCFRCHGPDANTRSADLRLDLREAALAARDGRSAIVPGDPDGSELLARVQHHDADERMPPADSGKAALGPAEIATLRAWIAAGAAYEAHWAFVPPVAPPVPAGSAAHPIDRFLDQARAQRGLAASPPADRATLARRLFLTLTGLPPTPAEQQAFVDDPAPDAYERLVDRLLGEEPYRSRCAEHMAQPWLDAGRYADTSGIHMDAGRQAWAWRDWLLQALRDDQPFDQFVLEQLAGDLLPDATTAQKVATGFLRNHVTTDEGGAIDEEYRVEYAAERTAVVGSVFLGLTTGCARCHDHKYDPIRQEDYFRLFAFFNSNQEPGLYSQIPDANRALEPFLAVPSAEQQQRQLDLERQLAAARRAVDEPSPAEAAAFAAFCAPLQAAGERGWSTPAVRSAVSRHGAELSIDQAGIVHAGGPNPDRDVHDVTLHSTATDVQWLLVEALPDPSLPHGRLGRASNGNAVLQHVRLQWRPSGADGPWQTVPFVYAIADHHQDDSDFGVANVFADDRRGWAVGAHLAPPRRATAMLRTAAPIGAASGAEYRVALHYDSVHSQHTFGAVQLRLGHRDAVPLARLPVLASGFSLCGPFADGPVAELYDKAFGPERGRAIDPAQRFGKQAWRYQAGLRDGVVNELPDGQHVHYVAQELWSPTARTVRIALGSDDGFQLYLDGTLVGERRIDRAAALDSDEVTVALPAGPSLLVLKVINTGGQGGFALRLRPGSDGAGEELAGDLRLLALPSLPRDAATEQRLQQAYRVQHSPHHREKLAELARLEQELEQHQAAVPRAMVMQEAEPRPTFVLLRGEYDKPDRERPVARELPAMFGALPADAPRNRLGLARWLVSEQNPLLLRVTVNRLWEFVFGTGIVRTSEDFGLQGEWPSHPELLDWLATEFRGRGHSTHAMLKLLVTSAAFRQQARVQEAAAAVDRDNRLLCWFPRRRLSAEAIRDQALYTSGLLVERLGGPSVKPYQPPGLWQEVAMTQSNTRIYQQQSGEALWRRSLYTYWKRACPPPSLLMLDAPTREFCTTRRQVTNTPLQALVLWNDEQFLEAARALAQRTLLEPDPAALKLRAQSHYQRGEDSALDDAYLQSMYRRCTGRTLAGAGLDAARSLLQRMRDRYREAPEDAAALLQQGQSPRAELPPGQLAPFVVLANAFLNLDPCLCID